MRPEGGIDPQWFEALTLRERLEIVKRKGDIGQVDTAFGRRVLARWRGKSGLEDSASYALWLGLLQATEERVTEALAVRPDVLQALTDQVPDWLDQILDILSENASAGPTWWTSRYPFVEVVRPLLDEHIVRLRARASNLGGAAGPFNTDRAVDLLSGRVVARLHELIHRTLALELHETRLRNLLSGDSPQKRFDSFIDRLRQPTLRFSFLRDFPVLARQCVLTLHDWVESSVEFLQRLTADYHALGQHFANGEEPGPLVDLSMEGDSHRHGRRVIVTRFERGLRVVYKPRSLSLDRHFLEIVEWLNQRGQEPPLRHLRLLDRGPYGWTEHVDVRPCENAGELEQFYRRQGAWVAFLHVLGAVDFHSENLLAEGSHPVLIDLEGLLHRRVYDNIETAYDLAKFLLGDSILTTGLLPIPERTTDKYDGSAIGGASDQLHWYEVPAVENAGSDEYRIVRKRLKIQPVGNQPTLAGAPVLPGKYKSHIEQGFLETWHRLATHAGELEERLSRFATDTTRAIVRASIAYSALDLEGWHPDMLRTALARDMWLDDLWVVGASRPYLQACIASEQRQLRAGDIPYFTSTPTSTDVTDADGAVMPQPQSRCGMDVAKERLAHIREGARWYLDLQTWLLRGSLNSLVGAALDEPNAIATPDTDITLQDAARAIAHHLSERAIRFGDTATWHTLNYAADAPGHGHYEFNVATYELYEGLSGIALFLAYVERAGAPTQTLLDATLAMLHRHLEREPPTSISAFGGWGGVLYLWAHLAALRRSDAYIDRAEEALPLFEKHIDEDDLLDLISGAAGAILCLLALHQVRRGGRFLEVAVHCGDHLLRLCAPQATGVGWPSLSLPRGLSHGTSGLALALLHLGHVSDNRTFTQTALEALRWEDSLIAEGVWTDAIMVGNMYQATWCHGAPGIALSRLAAWRLEGDEKALPVARRALEAVVARGALDNHSLCHGIVGNLEPLLVAQDLLPAEEKWAAALREGIEVLMVDLRSGRWRTALPGQLDCAGLMTGLSGVGYGLLRLSDRANVPSVLMLEAPKARIQAAM